MAAPVSIVIPTLNAEAALAESLPFLIEGLEAGLVRELVISDGGSVDETRALASAAGAVVVTGRPGRGGQLRRGAGVARGDWLLVLHADTHLPPGWTKAVRAVLGDPGRAWAFRLSFRATGPGARWVAGWANLRSRIFGLPYGDQGLLISRSLYDEVGGFCDIPLMEDVALVRALGGRVALLPATVSTGAARYLAEGWLRRGARNLWTQARYLGGADPAQLAADYAAGSATPPDLSESRN